MVLGEAYCNQWLACCNLSETTNRKVVAGHRYRHAAERKINMATDQAAELARKIPPYVSFVSFGSMLDWLASMDAMPAQIDRSLWSSKFSGATGSSLVSASRFLGLLENEQPTVLLEELVRADKESRPATLEKVLRASYGNEIVDQASTMTPKMFDDQLRAIGTTDATHRKAASFLTNALKAAGVSVQPTIAKRARNRRPSANRRAANQSGASDTKNATRSQRSTGAPETATATSGVRNERKLTLQNGETVSLITESDVFSLPADDFEWLLSVIRMFDEYPSRLTSEEETDSRK